MNKNPKEILSDVKNAIRHPYAWPGGYPVYTVLTDGEVLCPDCAREEFRSIVASTKHGHGDEWAAYGTDVLWEGKYWCGHCGKELESAYGEDEEETDDE